MKDYKAAKEFLSEYKTKLLAEEEKHVNTPFVIGHTLNYKEPNIEKEGTSKSTPSINQADLVALKEQLTAERVKNKQYQDKIAVLEELNEKMEAELEDNSEEVDLDDTQKAGFTKGQLSVLLYGMALLSEGKMPVKSKLANVIAAVGGFRPKSVYANLKGAFSENDKETVINTIGEIFPKLAAKIRKSM